jgi:hypothetical protein
MTNADAISVVVSKATYLALYEWSELMQIDDRLIEMFGFTISTRDLAAIFARLGEDPYDHRNRHPFGIEITIPIIGDDDPLPMMACMSYTYHSHRMPLTIVDMIANVRCCLGSYTNRSETKRMRDLLIAQVHRYRGENFDIILRILQEGLTFHDYVSDELIPQDVYRTLLLCADLRGYGDIVYGEMILKWCEDILHMTACEVGDTILKPIVLDIAKTFPYLG